MSSLLSCAGSLGMLALACSPSSVSATNHAVCRRFTDFPFTTEVVRDSRDARRFCGHAEVLAYLDAFGEFYRLRPHIRYGRRVLRALPLWADQRDEGSGPRWRITTCAAGHASQVCRCALGAPADWTTCMDHLLGCRLLHHHASHLWQAWREHMDARRQDVEETVFDALVVCNGHYSVPRTPVVAGAGAFPGRQMHSHSYRDARPFAGQTVVVVGAAASGEDIGREVADVADTARPAFVHALAAPHLLPVPSSAVMPVCTRRAAPRLSALRCARLQATRCSAVHPVWTRSSAGLTGARVTVGHQSKQGRGLCRCT